MHLLLAPLQPACKTALEAIAREYQQHEQLAERRRLALADCLRLLEPQ